MTDYTVLPPNASVVERGLDLAFGKLLDRIEPPFPDLMDPLKTPVDFLPYLAADRGVTEWNSAAPEAEKRLTVALAWPTKRLAGTRRALENAILGLQLTPDVTAWYEQTPLGQPYTFTVRAFADKPYSEEINARLDRRIGEAKSERDVLAVSIGLSVSGTHYVGAATVGGELTTIYPFELEGLDVSSPLYMAAGLYSVEKTTLRPLE
ncbi:phage tail protein I [Pseudomonas viridiflava]|uniref:phage tail protein I n=1 Tax=Pseudomonas viridiflava TaxID=33069 RepID=UPI000F03DBD1|nr:phage tail protein I [Pseudomonas viridiflava]